MRLTYLKPNATAYMEIVRNIFNGIEGLLDPQTASHALFQMVTGVKTTDVDVIRHYIDSEDFPDEVKRIIRDNLNLI